MTTKVCIGTPMYNAQCYHGYVGGLLETIKVFVKNNIEFDYNFLGNESLITRGRNLVVDYFLNTNCTHLCFIDSDIYFPGNAIQKLLETKHDFVCAPYPKKVLDWVNIKNKTDKNKNLSPLDIEKCGASYVLNLLEHTNIDQNNTTEIRHGGTGFMLLSRKVFEQLKPSMKQTRAATVGPNNNWYTEFFKTSIDKDGLFLTEDWKFCDDWRSIGGKVFMRLDIELSHIGTHVYTGNLIDFGANIN